MASPHERVAGEHHDAAKGLRFVSTAAVPATADCTCLTHRVEAFLAHDAWLLDGWKLEEWFALVAPDIRYHVPSADCPDGDPDHAVTFINDDYGLLRGRITRLQSRHAHREYPTSRTRRFVTNVRAWERPDGVVEATASFQIFRFRLHRTAAYIGFYELELVPDGASFTIRKRKATLDQEALDEHGAISIIL
jgi:p-cumate 2,3-dioxygenase subunit beta